jgi:hypothetical protein
VGKTGIPRFRFFVVCRKRRFVGSDLASANEQSHVMLSYNFLVYFPSNQTDAYVFSFSNSVLPLF